MSLRTFGGGSAPTSGVPSDALTASKIAAPGNVEFDRGSGFYFPTTTSFQPLRAAIARARIGGPPARLLVKGDSTTDGTLGGSAPTGNPPIVNVIAATAANANATLTSVSDYTDLLDGQTLTAAAGLQSATLIATGGVAGANQLARTLTMSKTATTNGAIVITVNAAASTLNPHKYSWVDQARTQAIQRNILGGLISECLCSFDAADSRLAFSGTFPVGKPISVTSANTGSMTFSDDSQSNAFDLWFLNSSGANGTTIAVSIDGGADVTLTAPSNATNAWTYRLNASGGTVGTHTVTIKPPAAGTMLILAIEPVNTTSPALLRIGRVGVSGQRLVDINPGVVTSGSAMASVLKLKPDHVHLHMGINDMHQWTTTNGTPAAGAATYLTNLGLFATSVNNAGAGASYTVWPSYNYADATQATRGVNEAIDTWHPQIYAAADAAAYGFVMDLARRWGYGVPPTGINALYDGTHPMVLGYADNGTMFADFLAML